MIRSRALFVLALVLAAAVVGQLSGADRAYATSPTLTFAELTGTSLTGVSFSSVAWGDYDSDGDLDILSTGYTTSGAVSEIYKNNGDGTFTEDTAADNGLAGVEYGSVAWGDYNSDGRLDILLTGYTTSGAVSKIYENNGGSFSEDTTADQHLTGVYDGSVAWGDYNSDGKPDILLTGQGNGGFFSRIYENNGNGTFSETPFTHNGGLPDVVWGSVAWGDYNSDGKPDILLTGYTGSGYVSEIYENNGDGTFTEDTAADSGLTDVYNSSVAWGDYDSDGDLDILLTGWKGWEPVSELYKNNGNSTFNKDTTAAENLTGVHSGSVAWGDYNSDGKPDILLTGWDVSNHSVAEIYANNSGTFIEDDIAESALTGVHNSSVAWGDYNSDGKPDILLTGMNDDPSDPSPVSSVYFQNDTATADTAPSAPASLAASPTSDSEVTLSWDAASDAEQPSGASLTYNLWVGTAPGASSVVSPMALASGTRLVPQYGNAGESTSYTLTGLTPGATYYWSVQAIDSSFVGSGFATEGSFTMAPVFAFSAASYSVNEADGTVTVTVNRTGLTTGKDTVHFATANGTATAGSDYTDETQPLTFDPGVTSRTIDIPISDDSAVESDETVQLTLSASSPGTIASPSTATLTIADNDRSFSFSTASYAANEGDGTAAVTITRAGLTTGSDTVHFATANGTATAGSDYAAVSQTVSFAAGVTSKTVSIPITDDSSVEGSETVQLSLSSPSAEATLGSPSSATLTIQDNDRSIAFSSPTYVVGEGAGSIAIVVNRSGSTGAYSDTVHFGTANGSASAGSDYTAVSQTVSFAPGVISKTVSVPISNDSSIESSETVMLSLSGPSTGATLGSPHAATLTITDNDATAKPAATTSKGKLVSAKLSKKSFKSSQARKVKLSCKFSPKSKVFRYVLSIKKGKKWTVVKRVSKTGFNKVKYTITVKKLFAGKKIKHGQYRLKLSADKNSKTLTFTVK